MAALVCALLGSLALGQTTFWGDLTYLHHAWRTGPAMLIAAGRAPLWEPSAYFGMPMAASMQGGLFYPPTVFYYFFGFATATALFQALHLFVAGFLCALWLRSWKLTWGASLGGSVVFAFGGLLVARLPYLNHLATLTWAPALALFFRRPLHLAICLALMVLAGYPTFVPGCAAAAWIAAAAARTERTSWRTAAAGWIAAALLSAALAAVQLLPGLELAAHSRRAGGVGLAESLIWGFSPRDLLQWIGPAAAGWARFYRADETWTRVYLGVAGAFLALCGAVALPRRRALVVLAAVAGVVALTLGDSNAVSGALWRNLPLLRFVRYPGNLAYLALLPLSILVAAGLYRRRGAPLLVLAAAVELVALGRAATPLAPRNLFVSPGPLVQALRERLDGTRYLISPRALHASSGADVFDWKQRLYGLTNAPYRLRAAVNFGEPLVPSSSYAAIDALQSLPGADAAAAWMPWIGASRLLTPAPALSARLVDEGSPLWHVARLEKPVSLAYQLPHQDGADLPAAWPSQPPKPGAPLVVRRAREDRFEVSGAGPGWAFVSEPRYPGWKTYLITPSGESRVFPAPALSAFQKVRTPAGAWTLRWRFDPLSWSLGLTLTWFSLLVLGASWYHRTR
ncbi:MAG: hypothetical protein HYZ74_01970 [Elusimicrobia bacterium]|nr:hypothetical protein [Elusimicrobiota bacterium]